MLGIGTIILIILIVFVVIKICRKCKTSKATSLLHENRTLHFYITVFIKHYNTHLVLLLFVLVFILLSNLFFIWSKILQCFLCFLLMHIFRQQEWHRWKQEQHWTDLKLQHMSVKTGQYQKKMIYWLISNDPNPAHIRGFWTFTFIHLDRSFYPKWLTNENNSSHNN